MPEDNEVVVNNGKNQVFGPNTVIQINLKTLVIVLGVILSGLGTLWVNINSKIDKSNDSTNKQIDKISLKLETIRDQDLKQLDASVNRLQGNVDIILEMNQQRYRQSNLSNSDNNNIQPVSNIRPERPK